MRVLLLFAVIAVFSQPAIAGEMDKIRARCQAEWPTKYVMQRYCIKGQTEASQDVVALYHGEASKGPFLRILEQCMAEWGTLERQTNWRMVAHCYRRERGAYIALTMDNVSRRIHRTGP
ncbi:UNVERIFIED_ORG: hypothetical protein GGE44_000233 [Rhizobium esperanzae]